MSTSEPLPQIASSVDEVGGPSRRPRLRKRYGCNSNERFLIIEILEVMLSRSEVLAASQVGSNEAAVFQDEQFTERTLITRPSVSSVMPSAISDRSTRGAPPAHVGKPRPTALTPPLRLPSIRSQALAHRGCVTWLDARNTSVPFVPPNPNEFDSATSSASRGPYSARNPSHSAILLA